MEKIFTTAKGERRQRKDFKGGQRVVVLGRNPDGRDGFISTVKECDWSASPQLFRVPMDPDNKAFPRLRWFPSGMLMEWGI
jgi:hypothetical protein